MPFLCWHFAQIPRAICVISFLLLLLPRSCAALPPDDFQLFALIFFVLLALGIVLSVAFAGALYFFLWYGQRKKEEEDGRTEELTAEEEQASRPIQWITTTYRDEPTLGLGWNAKQARLPQVYASPVNRQEQYLGTEIEAGRGQTEGPTIWEGPVQFLMGTAQSIREGWNKLISNLSRRRAEWSSSSPASTIFPALSPPPSYISAVQSPELFANWATPPVRVPPPPSSWQSQQPKGILKKRTMPTRWPGNGRHLDGTRNGQISMPVQRGSPEEVGRQPPAIQNWRWHPEFSTAPGEQLVEDRLEREESCVRGKLVAVERLTRTTTTTKMLPKNGRNWAPAQVSLDPTFIRV